MEASALFALALGVFLFALISKRAEAGVLTAPMVFTAFGFLIGGGVLDVVDLPVGSGLMHDLAEITLVIVLFTDAARIDLRRLGRQHDVPIRLLAVGLPLTMVAGTGVAMLLFPDLELWPAAVLAVILAPTDAALGQAVVSDERVPERVRQALNVESGLNDGLAFPALLVAVSVAAGAGAGEVGEEARGTAGWAAFAAGQLLLGPLAGVAVGFVGAWLGERAIERGWMNAIFVRISTLTLALLAYAGAELIGGNGFIGAFVCGLVVGTRSRDLLDGVEDFGETEGQLLTLIVFLLLGAVLLPGSLEGLGWRHLAYAVLSLTVVRMVPVTIALVGVRMVPSTVLFVGRFGPRGLASIIYLLLVVEGYEIAGLDDIELTILMSVVLHGVTASPLSAAYGRHVEALGAKGAGAERRPVFPFPIRFSTTRRKARAQDRAA